MTSDFNEGLTIYRQIALTIEDSILEGILKPEERLSSLRESAVEMEVNINTIMKAYHLLESENILIKKRGLGFFVSPDSIDIIQQKRRKVFFQQTLPNISKTMKLLGIQVDELIHSLKKEP
ncbi:DNA-binding transcriptional regulator YhcF, GntR family [Tindallia magadiensis]|uniref:DNA-binding transcriptional regulator YhcF, GntR family n=1 Tax=Tindallia magadiensis TaxID=69895 RepID=A0A1I3H8G2_9FIRM|nr:GntR family transcriptional regulator [Tindallia magadiensis]SFI31963.1 DNA-binding transcriptional regulator YhcF, GntR family [Tindallia magadiensis]